jgi:nicotinate-nucleotide adenylyltransferase
MKRIGYFGGTFDPIHFGHLNLLVQIMEKCNLDEILISPAYISPHKLDTPPFASPEDRMKMAELATLDIPNVKLINDEINNHKISYTIDVLNLLVERLKDSRIYLIMAEDVFDKFHLWKDYEKILDLVNLLIGCSLDYEKDLNGIYPEKFLETLKKSFVRIDNLEISSTQIRSRLKDKLYCGHLVPAKVLDYIYQNQLY